MTYRTKPFYDLRVRQIGIDENGQPILEEYKELRETKTVAENERYIGQDGTLYPAAFPKNKINELEKV